MTAVLSPPDADRAPVGPRSGGRSCWRLLPWIFPALAAAGVLHGTGTPDRQIAIYGLYFLFAVVLPGTLVLRALYGSRGNWPEDLGLGAATGLLVMVAGWALAAATGLQALLPAWPALILVLFLAVPKLRRCVRIADPTPLPLAWSWSVAAVLVMIAVWGVTVFENTPLPPATGVIYQDLYYHLALVHEMTRSMPFQVPQLAGDELRYHYLSDADMAAASMITDIPAATVLLRLWVLPMAATAAVVFAAVGRAASGSWQAGALAAALGFVGHALTLGSPTAPAISGLPVSLVSPSQTYAMPLIGLFTLIALEALRGRPLRWAWAMTPVLALVCAGAKSSVLPPLAAGIGLAGLVLFRQRRRIPWVAVGLLGSIVLGILLGFRLFAGGGAGTLAVQPLQVLRWVTPYNKTLGAGDGLGLDGLLLPGMVTAGVAGWAFVAGLVGWWVLMQAPRLIGLVLPPRSPQSPAGADPARWLLGGVVVAGTGGLWLFAHPSLSQGYFYFGVMPAAGVLTAWALADRVRNWRIPLAAAAAGAAWQVLGPEIGPPARHTMAGWAWSLAAPVLLTAAVVAVAVLAGVLARRSRAVRALPVLLIAAVAGGALGNGAYLLFGRAVTVPPAAVKMSPSVVTAGEMRAALWLEDNAGADDVIATNVHCVPIDAADRCNARAFWVAGLGGRRTLVESWGYADQAVAAHGTGGLSYTYQPAPYPEVFALNERVFREAGLVDVARLRDEHGVRWLLADTRAGPVAPGLARVADVRFTGDTATVYELRG
ncbi:hypothetical protein QLQ12_17910 [Actinoplanes sp. NEAU-A12]|uniref:Glycosyltransferase RgtA/B/C/D-like domain-containing protein n=1 Tax=Actinoplanes sandaracinus TaxID=3045177 RepID=A0ABT6WLA7_9ACTN|nr:hypothetical protein [Actinoplanes sandaracinus]MDI6100488.1 hypothetical protein [Actinoplanes sandaracinus]